MKYSIHCRNGIFYVQFFNPEAQKFGTAKSTGKTSRDEAVKVIDGWVENGIPVGRLKRKVPEKKHYKMESIICDIKNGALTEDDISEMLRAIADRGFYEYCGSGVFLANARYFLSRFLGYIGDGSLERKKALSYFRGLGIQAKTLPEALVKAKAIQIRLRQKVRQTKEAMNA